MELNLVSLPRLSPPGTWPFLVLTHCLGGKTSAFYVGLMCSPGRHPSIPGDTLGSGLPFGASARVRRCLRVPVGGGGRRALQWAKKCLKPLSTECEITLMLRFLPFLYKRKKKKTSLFPYRVREGTLPGVSQDLRVEGTSHRIVSSLSPGTELLSSVQPVGQGLLTDLPAPVGSSRLSEVLTP